MFRTAYRSSSGALTVFAASGLHTHVREIAETIGISKERVVPTQT